MNPHVLPRSEIAANLKSLLLKIAGRVDAEFSGLGIIVWDGAAAMPIHPMRDRLPAGMCRGGAQEWLIANSRESSAFHDGFHVFNQSLQLVQPAVYFSPAIVPGLVIPAHARSFGGRYLAAVFGSCLQGVLCTGVLSRTYGPYVFRDGREV
ncbi:hypothetical protein QTI17_01345 [Variovorax sp. J31P179]|uniref:hypothetical protein n=1 Tax=Variovorax sp. J31P179 TaxID=3053508 RepID=UPI00257719FF|nr:hypothetical protein [Variovorax sp. J31P179]MDM0079226.1 hypothetical protein [Variovorax sp. J31P179]